MCHSEYCESRGLSKVSVNVSKTHVFPQTWWLINISPLRGHSKLWTSDSGSDQTLSVQSLSFNNSLFCPKHSHFITTCSRNRFDNHPVTQWISEMLVWLTGKLGSQGYTILQCCWTVWRKLENTRYHIDPERLTLKGKPTLYLFIIHVIPDMKIPYDIKCVSLSLDVKYIAL